MHEQKGLKMGISKVKISISLDPEVYQKIKKYAYDERRTVSSFINVKMNELADKENSNCNNERKK